MKGKAPNMGIGSRFADNGSFRKVMITKRTLELKERKSWK
jgi:hypothetical protein